MSASRRYAFTVSAGGFSLLEVLIAVAVLSLTAAVVAGMQLRALQASEATGKALRATLLAHDYLARKAVGASPPAAGTKLSAAACRGSVPCGGAALQALLVSEWSSVTGVGGARGALRGMLRCDREGPYSAGVTLSWPAVGAYGVPGGCAKPGGREQRSLSLYRYQYSP